MEMRTKGRSTRLDIKLELINMSCVSSVCLYRKPHLALSTKHNLLGQPKCGVLQSCEASLFEGAGITIEPYMFYSHVSLVEKDRTITPKSCSRSIKRNDLCVKYTASGTSKYGILQRIVFNTTTTQCYALIYQLLPAPVLLCQDSISEAKLNEHIISFNPLRYKQIDVVLHVQLLFINFFSRESDLCIIHLSDIIDKCMIMEVEGILYVSTLHNTSELE